MVMREIIEECLLKECYSLYEDAARVFASAQDYDRFLERVDLIRAFVVDLRDVNKVDTKSLRNYIGRTVDEVPGYGVRVLDGRRQRIGERYELRKRC